MAETENNTKALLKDKKRFVKALYSYSPVNIDELQLKENDILEVIEETEEGWWKGILNGNVGMFPSNFVIELPEDSNKLNLNEISPSKIKTKTKNIDLHDSDLKHDVPQSISTKRDIKPNNMSSSSEEIINIPKFSESTDKKIVANKKNIDAAPRLPPKPVREQARVIYPYTALNEDELTLKEGDIITVISKEIEDKGWWKGELNNRTGVFPDNFVQLIKVEEQKKPERPDKPSIARSSKASLRASHPEKNVAPEISPKADKTDKSTSKTPPTKPPPPEVHKKEIERPSPPFPNKKPQVPNPLKKPFRSSLGSKFSGFSPPAANSVTKIEVVCPAPVPASSATESKLEAKSIEKEEKTSNKDSTFEGLEPSEKKLVHLTANRAKAPNRRPPSHIFLKETEKDKGTSPDPRRLSEPLLSEMKSVFEDMESHKNNTIERTDVKSKAPPSRPMPPSIKTKTALQGSVLLTKTISSEECIVKAPEPIKKSYVPDVSAPEEPKEMNNIKPSSLESELQELKQSFPILSSSMVGRNEYEELCQQVKELKESLENCNNLCKRSINELKVELDVERKQRQALELELQKLKGCQTT